MVGLSLKRLSETQPVELHWRAFELHPAGAPPVSPEYRARVAAGRPIFAARLKREHDVVIDPGPHGINTRNLHILKKYADAHGVGNEFHDAALDAYWKQGRDISAVEVQEDLMRRVGLNEAPAAILEQPEFKREVFADERFAYQNGITGVPAMVFAEKYLVVGAQPLEVLQQVVEQVRAESWSEGTESNSSNTSST